MISPENALKAYQKEKAAVEAWKQDTGFLGLQNQQEAAAGQAAATNILGSGIKASASLQPFGAGERTGLDMSESGADAIYDKAYNDLKKEYGSVANWVDKTKAFKERFQDSPNLAIGKGVESAIGGAMKVPFQGAASLLETIAIGSEAIERASGGTIGDPNNPSAEKKATYKLGQDLRSLAEGVNVDKDFQGGNAELFGNVGGQVLVQTGLALLTGGAAAPALYGASQGIADKYREAGQFKDANGNPIGPWERLGASLAAGMIEAPDYFIFKGMLGKTGLLQKLKATVQRGLVERGMATTVAEKAAVEATDGFLSQMIAKGGWRETVGTMLQKGAGQAKIAGFEGVQEGTTRPLNDLAAYMIYDPSPERLEKATTLTSRDLVEGAAGFFGGWLGASFADLQTRAASLSEEARQQATEILEEIKTAIPEAEYTKAKEALAKPTASVEKVVELPKTNEAKIPESPAPVDAAESVSNAEISSVETIEPPRQMKLPGGPLKQQRIDPTTKTDVPAITQTEPGIKKPEQISAPESGESTDATPEADAVRVPEPTSEVEKLEAPKIPNVVGPQLSEMYRSPLDTTSGPRKVVVADVSDQEASDLLQKTGIALKGKYRHVVDQSALSHVRNEHGDPETEESRGLIAITEADIERIPEILQSPDLIEDGGKQSTGLDTIRYTKRFNGETIYVEEVRRKRRDLALLTMFKKKSSNDDQMPEPPVSTPETTVALDDASTDSASVQQNEPVESAAVETVAEASEVKDDRRGLSNADITTQLNRFTKSGDLHKYVRRIKDFTREQKIRLVENLRAGDDPPTAIRDAKDLDENLGDPGEQPRSPATGKFENKYRDEVPDPLGDEHAGLDNQEAHARALLEKRLPLEMEPQPGFEKSKVSHIDVIKSYQKVLENLGRPTPIRIGHMSEKSARGIYKPKAEVIRLREAGNIPTASHEIFHGVQKVMFGAANAQALKPIPKAAMRELVKLGQDLYGSSRPAGGYRTEGFAEFGRLYLTQDDAQQKAPAMHRYFTEQFLPKQPELADGLKKARELTDAYRKQGAHNRDSGNTSTLTIRRRLRNLKEQMTKDLPTQFVDELTPLIRLTDAVEKASGMKLSPGENPASVAMFLRGNSSGVVHYMAENGMVDAARNKTGKPLSDIASIVRGKELDFWRYMKARRSVERWGKGKNPGMSQADAEFLVQNLETPEFQLAAQAVYDWNAGVLNYVKGMVPDLSPAIESILRNSLDYVPLNRDMSESEAVGLAGRYKGFGHGGFHKMKGSGRRVKAILPQMIANAERMISMAHKRRVLDAIVRLSELEGVGSLIEEVPKDQVPTSVNIAEIEKALTDAGADLKDVDLDTAITFFTPAKAPKGEDPIVPIMKDGKMRWYQVPADLYNTLSGLDMYRLPKLLDLLFGAPTRLFRLGTTGLRASFSLVTNPTRDLQTLFMQSQAKNPAKLMANYAVALTDALNPKRAAGAMSPALDAYYRLGINLAQPLGMDEAITSRYAKHLMHSIPRKVVTSPINTLRELFSVTESVPRIAELRSIGEEVGWTPGDIMTFDQAVQIGLAGKQATVDFSAAGKAGKVINQVTSFFNANVQGSRSFVRAFQRNPTKATLMGLLAITIPTLLNWWRNKDEEWYVDMIDREKHMYWNVKTDKEILQIPRAQEWGGLFATVPEAIADSWYRKDPEGFKASMGYIFDLATPPVLPTVAKTAKEQWQNRIEFFDRPIVPKAEEDLPPSEQVGQYTSEVAKWLGQHLPDLKIAGIPINSPRRIDAVIRSIGGGVGSDLVQLPRTVTSDREREMADLPVFGRLFRRGGQGGTGSKTIDKFYDELTLARQKEASKSDPETPEQRVYRLQLEDAAKAMSVLRQAAGEATTEQRKEITTMTRDIAKRVIHGESPFIPNEPTKSEDEVVLAKQKDAFKRLESYFEGQTVLKEPPGMPTLSDLLDRASTDDAVKLYTARKQKLTPQQDEVFKRSLRRKARSANRRGTLTEKELETIRTVIPNLTIHLRKPSIKAKKDRYPGLADLH